ncbi:MAG TPA: dTDP-glucose 4,6-dehydratase [Candidatus Limnocylindrales bacterium]|nr:dTDP-glucose 4,6-dehydratase [Candidatus Limnocylindrales bacterium]
MSERRTQGDGGEPGAAVHRPRNVLVTGGAGFIGCNFVRYLLATDPDVRIVDLDALTYAGSLENLTQLPDPARHTFVHGDICDRALVDRLLRESDIDTIVHFAADSHVDRSIAGPAPFIQTNIVGTFQLLEAARELWLRGGGGGASGGGGAGAGRRFHHISTDEVYGTLGPDDPAFTETTPYAPGSPYSASKAASDHLVRAYWRTYGLPVTISNCSNNFGPFQHAEKFLPTVIRGCLTRTRIPVYGDGSNVRDWLYVDDHCRGIDAVVRRGRTGEFYNIGGLNEWSNIELVRRVCAIMDQLRPAAAPHFELVEMVTDRPGHDWRYAIDITKIRRALGWQPQEPFDAALRKTIEWYAARMPARG